MSVSFQINGGIPYNPGEGFQLHPAEPNMRGEIYQAFPDKSDFDIFKDSFLKGFKLPFEAIGDGIGELIKGSGEGLKNALNNLGPNYTLPLFLLGGSGLIFLIIVAWKI